QLSELGLLWHDLGLTPDYLDPSEIAVVELRDDDPVWTISQLETRLYLGNMLLRDSDVNGMAHSLEIRVPLLDQRVLDLVLALPGKVRLPPGAPLKHLLRHAFADVLPPAVLQQGKRGFTLPIRRWMTGALRPMCQQGLSRLKSTGLLNPRGVDAIWNGFLREPESPIWSRAWMLCVLGLHLQGPR
ncbi:MAG: asparagine synthase C-terminal domain-containing protein, partial [Phycisphaerae bacterium]|nr:asparagine synthase C-terminal domain-containing protein [Phycisphaerae bacterium]